MRYRCFPTTMMYTFIIKDAKSKTETWINMLYLLMFISTNTVVHIQ